MEIDSALTLPSRLELNSPEGSLLHDALVRLAGADQSIVRPNRNASPLPLLDHLGVSLFDERADMGERLAPPVVQFLDPRVDQPRRGFAFGGCALFHIVGTSFGCFSILRRYQSPIIRASLPARGRQSRETTHGRPPGERPRKNSRPSESTRSRRTRR